MGQSASIASYEDMREIAEKALLSPKGIRVKLANEKACMHFRHRFYKFRVLDREASQEVYFPEDPQYGVSAYDTLKVVITPEFDEHRHPVAHYIEIKPIGIGDLVIEEIK